MKAKKLWTVLAVLAVAAVGLLFALSGEIGASSSPGTTERVSVSSSGAEALGESAGAAISGDGRFVAFSSWASNLVSGDTNGYGDVFVHDRVAATTERVSVDSAGSQGDSESSWPAISGDGRYVSFVSFASNLVPGDTNVCHRESGDSYNCLDVFVHDRETGLTERVSVDSGGNQGNNDSGSGGRWGWGIRPAISGDGRFVAFSSLADNLVAGDTNGFQDVFVHDRETGDTMRVSVDSSGNQASGDSRISPYGPAISGDGRFVVFESDASNLFAGDTNGHSDVFVHDRQTGSTSRLTPVCDAGYWDYSQQLPSISADGRYVAVLQGQSMDILGGPWCDPEPSDWGTEVFVYDRETGAVELAVGDSSEPSISPDGRFVAYRVGTPWGVPDLFVKDWQTGTTEAVAVDTAGNPANAEAHGPAISADGRFVAFDSWASNLVPDDTNNAFDVFVRDRCPDGSCGGPTPTPTPTPEPFRYIATGDSIPSGVDLGDWCLNDPGCHSNASKAYPAGLKLLLSFRVGPVEDINMACSGTKSCQYAQTPTAECQNRIQPDPCGHNQLRVALDNDPNLVTITLGADDKVLGKLATDTDACLNLLPDFSKALQCARALKATGRAVWWDNLRANLSRILTDYQTYLNAHPDALVVVTNYYNPMRQPYPDIEWAATEAAICSGLAAPFPPPLNAVVLAWCGKEFADANAVLKEVDSIINRLNTEVANAVTPFEASSGGRIRLVNIHDQFVGHCSPILINVTVAGITRQANLGCSESDSWIAAVHSIPWALKFKGIGLSGTVTGGVHPNENGQWLIANIIWNAIEGRLP